MATPSRELLGKFGMSQSRMNLKRADTSSMSSKMDSGSNFSSSTTSAFNSSFRGQPALHFATSNSTRSTMFGDSFKGTALSIGVPARFNPSRGKNHHDSEFKAPRSKMSDDMNLNASMGGLHSFRMSQNGLPFSRSGFGVSGGGVTPFGVSFNSSVGVGDRPVGFLRRAAHDFSASMRSQKSSSYCPATPVALPFSESKGRLGNAFKTSIRGSCGSEMDYGGALTTDAVSRNAGMVDEPLLTNYGCMQPDHLSYQMHVETMKNNRTNRQ